MICELINRNYDMVYENNDLELLYTYKKFPVFMGCTNIPIDNDQFHDMNWYISKSSGTIQLNPLLPLNIVYQLSHYSGTIGKLWDEHHSKFAEFILKFSPENVLEIGGLHGTLAKKCKSFVDIDWTIIDPNASSILSEYNINAIKGFFDENFVPDKNYKMIVHSHLLEHVYDINKFLKNSSTIGISSGIEFDFETNKYKTVDSIYYDFIGNKILSKSNAVDANGTFSLQERDQKSIYVTVPLNMIFRTSLIGNFRYFGKFGIRNSFQIKNSVNDYGVDVTDINQQLLNAENNNYSSPGDMFFYKGAIGLSAGAEWKFIETTSLVAEVGYFYGITPLHLERKEANRTLYTLDNGTRTYFSNKANQNQLLFKISILF